MKFRTWLTTPFIILILGTGIASGQVATGAPPFGSFGGGPFDTVNLGNLNVHFSVPILYKAGRGMPFSYTLAYDSSVWSPVSVSGQLVWQPAFNWGWTAQSAVRTGYISYYVFHQNCDDQSGHQSTEYRGWTYYDPWGVVHIFGPGLQARLVYDPYNCSFGTRSSMSATATDGSGVTVNATLNGQGVGTHTITTRAGTILNPPVNLTGGYSGSSSSVTDANGNQISVSSTSNSATFTDTLGTTAMTVSGSSPVTFSYTAPSGSAANYTLNYQAYTVKTNFGVSGVSEYGRLSNALVDNIRLPDGSEYKFTYEQTPGGSGACTPLAGTYTGYCVTGRIASVTLPTGGAITYAYSGGSQGIESDGSTAGLSRTLNPGGVWQYGRTQVSGAHWQTKITTPPDPLNSGSASDVTLIDFQKDGATTNPTYNFYETQRVVNQGASTVLATITKCYNANYANCTTTAVSSPFTQMDVYSSLPNGQTRLSEVLYNSSGLVKDDKEYNYGVTMGAAPGNTDLVRETAISYASLGNGIVNRPSSVTVYDWSSGSQATLASSTYTYDQGTPTGTSGTPQHVTITGSRGNLTTATTSTSRSTSLSRTYTYYDTGNPYVVTDVNNAQTTYVYGSLSCGNSFATTINEPLSLSRSITSNCTGGIATQVADENGNNVTSNYTDSDFWRPANVLDQLSNQTDLSYIGQTSVEASLQNFNSGNSVSDSRTTVDGFGRPILSQRLQGPGATNYDSTEIDYDNMGRPSRSTMPFSAAAGGTSSSAPGTQTTYDALGRVLTVTDANGGQVSYTYTNNDVLQAVSGGQTFKKQLEYDGLGRLTAVCEMTQATGSGTCNQSNSVTGFWTKYGYDALGHLLTVTQNAQAAAASQQKRAFAYDMLGRMTSENNPETGNSGVNGTITYTYDSISPCGDGHSYSSGGDVVQKKDNAGNTTCYSYDALHRVLTAGNSTISGATLRKFVYDSEASYPTGVSVSYGKTHMVEAQTTSTSGSVITDEFFSYDKRGELTDVYESTPHSSGYYHTTASYWPTGTLQSLSGIPGVPTINYGAGGAGLDGEGRVTQVTASSGTNPVTTVTYSTSSTSNPLGALTGVTFGSADGDSFTYDPNTGRMGTYTFSVNGKTDQGTLTWNANGTLVKLVINDQIPGTADSQTCNYSYDDLQRLESSSCGSLWSQTFSYDAFGNITKSGSSTFAPGYTFANNATTNQFYSLPGVTPRYDANGNLLTDNLNTYTWDPNWGIMLTVNNGSSTVTATYDALGRMVENNSGGSWREFIYGPTGKLAIANGQTLVKALIALPGGAKAIYNSSGLAYFRHSDWLGSSRLTSTATRPTSMYSSSAYAPFGEQYATAGSADASFTGQDQDTVNNLYDFPVRRQSPSQGRWISPDPAGRAAVVLANPQSWNRYAYVNNNPLRLIDQLGMDPCAWEEDGDGVFCGLFGDDDNSGNDDSSGEDCGDNCPAPPLPGANCPEGYICSDQSYPTGANINVSALGNCLGGQFGVALLYASPTVGNGTGDPGNMNGSATIMFGADQGFLVGTITNDIMSVSLQNMQQPSSAYVNPGTGTTLGFTNPGDPWTNYTATGTLGQAAVDVQVQELGNSIAVIQGTIPAQYPGQPVLQSPEQDPGATTLNCYQDATGTS